MRGFAVMFEMQFRLFLRDFFSFFFALAFPVLMLLLFGGIYGNAPIYDGFGMMDICAPAYSVMVIGVTGLMSLPLTISGYKEKKIYKRFDAAPVGKKSVMLAQALVNFTMTLIGISLLLITARILYHIQIKGSFLSICASALFSIASLFSLGFLFTAIGRDLKSATSLCYLFYFVMLFLSGATMPDLLFPETIRKISQLLPMTYAVDLMQGVFAGDSLHAHGMELCALGFSALLFAVVGTVLYRKKDWT